MRYESPVFSEEANSSRDELTRSRLYYISRENITPKLGKSLSYSKLNLAAANKRETDLCWLLK